MFSIHKPKVFEITAGTSQDRKDYVGLPFLNKQVLSEHIGKPKFIGRFEVRPIQEWGDDEFINTDDTVYLSMWTVHKERLTSSDDTNISVGMKNNYRPKTTSKPKTTTKPKITPKPTTKPITTAKPITTNKPKPKKEVNYGIVEFLADFFTEWTKRRQEKWKISH